MNRKRIKINLLFILATLSLLATGFWIHPTELMPNIFLTSYFSICGTWVIYGLEVNHRENNSLLSLFKALNKHKGQQLFVLHLIIITPIFIYFSSPASPALSPPPFFLVRPLFYCVLLLR